MPQRLRIGVLGAANIARAFTTGCRPSEAVEVTTVASRGEEKAKAFAAELGIPRAHGSYEALLADPQVDAIYIPLPNSLHAEWAIRSAEAGKHVLCEKPLAISAAEARAMFAAAERHGIVLREAYPYMAQPQTLDVRRWLVEGAIGRLSLIRAGFSVLFDNPANIRLIPDLGGGAIYDLGSYVVSFVRLAAGRRPKRVQAAAVRHTSGVDLTTTANLDFGDGLLAQIACSFSGGFHRSGAICGDKGVIETNFLNHPPMGGPSQLRIRRGVAQTIPYEDAPVPEGNGFRLSAESFARLLREGDAAWTGATPQESIDIAATIDAIRNASDSGRWETVEG